MLANVCYNHSEKGGGRIKSFCFTVDDNIRVLKELTENRYVSLFDHPYLAMYQRLHRAFGVKVQLNLFYRMEGFSLSQMSEAYYGEWEANADWLKLSFHSALENQRPYEGSGYDEAFGDCKRVHEEIRRFASPAALASTTTIHYCLLTESGMKAIEDNGVVGLLGLFGTNEAPRTSYGIAEGEAARIREGEILKIGNLSFASIDAVLNNVQAERIPEQLASMSRRDRINVMIHEQYFYEDYPRYQPEFEEKLRSAFSFLRENGYQSRFFEDVIAE